MKLLDNIPMPAATHYRMYRMNGGSEKYGVCDICGKRADTMYGLVRLERRHNAEFGNFTVCRGASLAGHLTCLGNKTR